MLLYRELQRSRLSDGKSKATSTTRTIPAATQSPLGSRRWHGATILPLGRLVTASKRWQPAARQMCGRQGMKHPPTFILRLLPISTMGRGGQSIHLLQKVALPINTCMVLRQALPIPGQVATIRLLLVIYRHSLITGLVPRGDLLLPALIQAALPVRTSLMLSP